MNEHPRKVYRMEHRQREGANLRKFRSIKPKAVNLSQRRFIRTTFLHRDGMLPLVLQPEGAEVDVVSWARGNRSFIEAQLLRHGALLFRGFAMLTVRDFERFVQATCPDVHGEYGDLPKEEQGRFTYQATPYPPEQTILFHNESSHLPNWPLKQWFFCRQAAREGGETPLVDCREVYRRLSPQVRDRFQEKQLMYVRNFIAGLDVSWQEFFHTTDTGVVEAYCRKYAIEFDWTENRGLRTRQICPAVATHPHTGERLFFNQIQLHHVSCLEPAVRDELVALLGEERLPRNVCYGDGAPIEDAVVAEIRDLYEHLAVRFPWQEGDMLMVDNMLVAHSRRPFLGPRKIVVAMGAMYSRNALGV